jgi:hypothetical protein
MGVDFMEKSLKIAFLIISLTSCLQTNQPDQVQLLKSKGALIEVYQVRASDPENDILEWKIISQSVTGLVMIDNTGKLYMTPENYEKARRIRRFWVIVQVSDREFKASARITGAFKNDKLTFI